MSDRIEYVIVFLERTGSTLLSSFLTCNDDLDCHFEALSQLNGRTLDQAIVDAFTPTQPSKRAVGFKFCPPHPWDGDHEAAWSALLARPGLRFIHLTRDSILDAFVSLALARATDKWADSPDVDLTKTRPTPDTIAVNPAELRRHYEHTVRSEGVARTRISALDPSAERSIQIAYEQLVADREGVMRRVFAFLGLESVKVASPLRKQATRRPSEVIANFDEMRAAFPPEEWPRLNWHAA